MKEKEFEIRGRPELLGLGRCPVPSYGWGGLNEYFKVVL